MLEPLLGCLEPLGFDVRVLSAGDPFLVTALLLFDFVAAFVVTSFALAPALNTTAVCLVATVKGLVAGDDARLVKGHAAGGVGDGEAGLATVEGLVGTGTVRGQHAGGRQGQSEDLLDKHIVQEGRMDR